MTSRTHIARFAALALLCATGALAQTATVSASTDLSCLGARANNLTCNAGDFTASATFTQPSQSTLSSCVAGSTVTVNLVANITSHSPDRNDIAFFFDQVGNNPNTDSGNNCSVGVAPFTPYPFENLDTTKPANLCGDFAGNQNATMEIDGVKVKCQAAPGTGNLVVPFTLVYAQGGANSCSASNVTAGAPSKCLVSTSTQVTTVGGTGVSVQGFVNLTKQTQPASDPQVFSFTADGGTVAPSTTSFSESAGQTLQVTIPLLSDGGVQNLQISEAQAAGWSASSTVTCTDLNGASAGFVTVDSANRRLTAALTPSNPAANCTMTNYRAAKVTIVERSVGGTAAFAFSGGNNGLPASLTLDTSTTDPVSSAQYTLVDNTIATSLTQTIPSGWTLGASCTDGTTTFGTLSGGTLSIPAANLTANANITCTFTDTRGPTLTKAFSPSTVAPNVASTLTFTLTNSSGNPAQSGLGFTDTFPAGLVVATPLSVTSTCGGSIFRGGTTIALAAGDTSLALSGGAIASSTASCTVSVHVSAASDGSYTNGAAQIGGLAGGVINGVTSQTLTVTSSPLLTLVKMADAPTKTPGSVITYTITAANTGGGNATSVVLSDHLGPYTSFAVDGFGAGVPFQFTDGSPSSGLTLGTPVYSSNGGSTFTYTPVSGGGGAPSGYDANVTDWKIPMSGTMPANGTCSVSFKAVVR